MKSVMYANNGYTVMEVILGLFLFGCVFTALLHAVHTADRIRGRSSQASHAALLAENEADRIRNSAAAGHSLKDSSYEQTVHGRIYRVKRRIIEKDPLSATDTGSTLQTIELEILNQSAESGTVFRFLQGKTP